jgi:hypothetical protein
MTDSPSSRVSAVVIMLGDLIAFWASFLILGDVIAAGALGIASFYVLDFARFMTGAYPHRESSLRRKPYPFSRENFRPAKAAFRATKAG